MASTFHCIVGCSLLTVAVTSCSIYKPTVPTLPAIRQAKQAEVRAGIDYAGFGVLHAAYSPVNHLLLTVGGATGFGAPRRDKPSISQRHIEVGVGGYLLPRPKNVLSTHWGVATGRGFERTIYGDTRPEDTHISFRRWHGQLGWQAYSTKTTNRLVNVGILYRFSRVSYAHYQVNSIKLYEGNLYSPTTAYYRIPAVNWHDVLMQTNIGSKRFPYLQAHIAIGIAVSNRASSSLETKYRDSYSEASQEHSGYYPMEFSLAFYPHLLHKKDQK